MTNINFKMFILISFLKINILLASSLFPENDYISPQGQGYYELDISLINALTTQIQEQDTPAIQSWKTMVDQARREPPTTDLSLDELAFIFTLTRKQENLQGSFAPVRAGRNEQEMINLVLDIFSNHEEAKTSFLQAIKGAHQIKEKILAEYYENIAILGQWRIFLFRSFINTFLLGKFCDKPRLRGAEELFLHLKNSGVLRTSIITTEGYRYSQKVAAEEFLTAHPEVHTLALGCGSFMPFEHMCSSGCSNLHHISKGEMTVSLYYPGYTEDTLSHDFSGSSADIIGDVASLDFWEGIQKGLRGRKLNCIKQHNIHQNSIDTINTLAFQAQQILNQDGILEIICKEHLTENIIQVLEFYPFNLESQNLIMDYLSILIFKFKKNDHK